MKTGSRESESRFASYDDHVDDAFHQQQQHHQADDAPSDASSFFSPNVPSLVFQDMVATPTGTVVPSKMDFQSPLPPQARLASAAMLATPAGKKALGLMLLEGASTPSLELPMSCNFEALSHHFHLPLKIAAEKFGVRATAFKKRCRAIGIRHWPYRKVRSLKRSLQELGRCRDQGLLNDRQHHQMTVFQSQLDKLLSPETYGIDPSGRLPPGAFDGQLDGDDNDSLGDADDDDDASCASSDQSPRVEKRARGRGYTALSDFKITSLRTKRSKSKPPAGAAPPPMKKHLPTLKRGDFALPPGIVTTSSAGAYSANGGMPSSSSLYYSFPTGDAPPTPNGSASVGFSHGGDLIPSVSVRFASHTSHASNGLPGFEPYDPFFQDFKSEFTLTMEDFGGEDSAAVGSYGLESSVHDDFFPFIRSPTMAALRAHSSTPHGRSSTRPSSSTRAATVDTPAASPDDHGDDEEDETQDDDVFLQISPDYGCLV